MGREQLRIVDAVQAKRLVRNSILSVETTDTQVDEVDFVDDAADVEGFVRSHRDGDDPSGSGAAPQGKPLILKHMSGYTMLH